MERRGRIREVSAGAEAARVPPHDLDAERAVIGAMLVSETAVAAVAEKITPEDFYSEVHRIIFGAMMRLYARGDPIDQLTLTNELRSVGEFEKVGGRAYVFQIVESVPTAANAGRYAEIVRGKALLRAVIDVGSRITEDAFREPEDVNEALDAAEQLIYGVSNRTLREHLSPVSELAPGTLEMIQRLYEAEGEVTGVETGFEDLDRLTTGFHKSDLVILAARPAMGKCLKWDSLVVDPESGKRLTIEQFVQRRLPRVLNVTSAGKIQSTSISNWIDSGIKPCFRVTTRSGRSVEVTGHHPFLTLKGWTRLHDLAVGAHIAVPRSVSVFGTDESWPIERVRLLAYFIAEGGLTCSTPRWTNADPTLVSGFHEALAHQFPEVVLKRQPGKGIDYRIVGPGRPKRMGSNPVTTWLRELGLMGKYAEEKFLPQEVWSWSPRYLAEFLRVLISCDGTIYKLGNYPRIEFSVSSQRLAQDVYHALTRFGIVAKLWGKKERRWRVEITAPDSVLRYQAEIGWIGEKALRFTGGALAERALPKRGSNYGHPPREVWDLVREPARRHKMTLSELGRITGETTKTGKYAGYNPHTRRSLPSYRLARYAEVLEDETLLRAASSDLLWDEIVSIEDIGEHQVYDLTVPDGSNFIAQDICVHNTALALNAIWHAAGQKGMPVAIFSLEMSKEQLVQRLISQTTRIPAQALRSGNVRAEDWPKLVRGVAEVSRAPIWIDDTAGVTLMEIRAKVRRLASRLNVSGEAPLSLVVVDYLQLMVGQNNRSENRQQEIAEISRGLKVLARDLDIPVLAVAQLSRAVEQRHDKRPLLSDLRDSGCLTGDTRIFLPDEGVYRSLGELVGRSGFRVLALNTETWKLEPCVVTNSFATGRKDVFQMVTRLGRGIRATANHKFLTISGWKRLDELEPGDRLALPRRLTGSPTASMTPEELALLGHMIGDGCALARQPIHYTTNDLALAEGVADLARRCFGEAVSPRVSRERSWYQIYLAPAGHLTHRKRNPVAAWLDELGVFGLRSYEKRVPDKVFAQPDGSVALFLKHLWATDGCIHFGGPEGRQRGTIYYATSSPQLARDVQSLLFRLGINASLRRVMQGTKGRDQYHVIVSGKPDLERFLDEVGGLGTSKVLHADEILRHSSTRIANTNRDVLPREVWHSLVVPAMKAAEITARQMQTAVGQTYCGNSLYRRNVSRARATRVASAVVSTELACLAESDVYWDEIVSIERTGEEEVYDLTVEGLHNFVANDIIVHNSIEQDADMVMFLYRDEYYNPDSDDKGIAEIIIGKHRNGPTGKVQLAWMEQYTKFASLARRV